MRTDQKREVLIQAVGDNWEDVNKTISHLIGKKEIDYKDRQKMIDCVVDTFLYGKEKQIDSSYSSLIKGKFPQYIRGLIYSLANKPRSSFNYVTKMEYNTVSLDDENAENIIQ